MPLARARTIVRIRQCMAARYRQGNWCEMLKGKTFKGSLRQGTLEIGEGCISGVAMASICHLSHIRNYCGSCGAATAAKKQLGVVRRDAVKRFLDSASLASL